MDFNHRKPEGVNKDTRAPHNQNSNGKKRATALQSVHSLRLRCTYPFSGYLLGSLSTGE